MSTSQLTDLSNERIEEYLSARLAARVEIKSAKQSFPGLSRETYLINAEVNDEPQGFSLRVDPPMGGGVPLPYSLKREYDVYERLWKSPIPVAEPLWYEQDIDFAQGRPHVVRRLVAGSTSISGLTDNTDTGASLRRSVVRDHIEHLAELHKLDWKRYGFDEIMTPPESASLALKHELAKWKELWFKDRTESFPIMTEAIHWLEENIPEDSPAISLVKGNNGVGEEIFVDRRIVAMSDWELADLSDGVLDIAFSQGTLNLDNYNDAIEYYGECVGQEVSPDRLAFATFMIMFKTIVCINTTFVRYHLEGTDQRISSPAFSLTVRQKQKQLAQCIGKDLVSALHDMSKPNAKSVYADIGAKQ